MQGYRGYIIKSGIDDLVKINSHGNTKYCNPNMLEINPAIGCQFQCQYCNAYTQERKTEFCDVIVYKDYPQYLRSFLEGNKDKLNKLFFYFSPKIDCFQNCLLETGITEEILTILKEFQARYFLVTKGKIPPENIQKILIDSNNINQVIISCTMPNENIRERIEPYAATIDERMKFAKFCIDNKIFTTGIFSPILPVENLDFVKKYIEKYISIGVNHFRVDFTEISKDSLDKLTNLLPEYKEEMESVYLDPNATTTHWKVPFKNTSIDRYWPSMDYMRKAFNSLKEYARSLDSKATVSVCNSLCVAGKLDCFNAEAQKRGINCIGYAISR